MGVRCPKTFYNFKNSFNSRNLAVTAGTETLNRKWQINKRKCESITGKVTSQAFVWCRRNPTTSGFQLTNKWAPDFFTVLNPSCISKHKWIESDKTRLSFHLLFASRWEEDLKTKAKRMARNTRHDNKVHPETETFTTNPCAHLRIWGKQVDLKFYVLLCH